MTTVQSSNSGNLTLTRQFNLYPILQFGNCPENVLGNTVSQSRTYCLYLPCFLSLIQCIVRVLSIFFFLYSRTLVIYENIGQLYCSIFLNLDLAMCSRYQIQVRNFWLNYHRSADMSSSGSYILRRINECLLPIGDADFGHLTKVFPFSPLCSYYFLFCN